MKINSLKWPVVTRFGDFYFLSKLQFWLLKHILGLFSVVTRFDNSFFLLNLQYFLKSPSRRSLNRVCSCSPQASRSRSVKIVLVLLLLVLVLLVLLEGTLCENNLFSFLEHRKLLQRNHQTFQAWLILEFKLVK